MLKARKSLHNRISLARGATSAESWESYWRRVMQPALADLFGSLCQHQPIKPLAAALELLQESTITCPSSCADMDIDTFLVDVLVPLFQPLSDAFYKSRPADAKPFVIAWVKARLVEDAAAQQDEPEPGTPVRVYHDNDGVVAVLWESPDKGDVADADLLMSLMDDQSSHSVSISDALDTLMADRKELRNEMDAAIQWVANAAKFEVSIPKMSSDEAAAVRLFVKLLWFRIELNEVLRAGRDTELPKFLQYLRLLQCGLLKCCTGEHKVLYRGRCEADCAVDPARKGKQLRWRDFAACCGLLQSLREPVWEQAGNRTIFILETSRACNVGAFSGLASEDLWLLPMRSAFEITGVLPRDCSGLEIITLKDADD